LTRSPRPRLYARKRVADYWWRLRQVLRDLLLVLPPILIALTVAVVAWRLSGRHSAGEVVQWAATVLAAVTAVPHVSAAMSRAHRAGASSAVDADAAAAIMAAQTELEVRRRLKAAERAAGPASAAEPPVRQALRLDAARRLAELERRQWTRSCPDTLTELEDVATLVEPGATTLRRLASAGSRTTSTPCAR
jgi:hypothetical protein